MWVEYILKGMENISLEFWNIFKSKWEELNSSDCADAFNSIYLLI